jgi:hypothetical protein
MFDVRHSMMNWKCGYVTDINDEEIKIHFKKEQYKNDLCLKIKGIEDFIGLPNTYS